MSRTHLRHFWPDKLSRQQRPRDLRYCVTGRDRSQQVAAGRSSPYLEVGGRLLGNRHGRDNAAGLSCRRLLQATTLDRCNPKIPDTGPPLASKRYLAVHLSPVLQLHGVYRFGGPTQWQAGIVYHKVAQKSDRSHLKTRPRHRVPWRSRFADSIDASGIRTISTRRIQETLNCYISKTANSES